MAAITASNGDRWGEAGELWGDGNVWLTMDTCYRHSDRETGRHCTRCGKAACHECLKTASVGSHCLDCVKSGTPPARERVRMKLATGPPVVTYALIALSVAAFGFIPGSGSVRLLDYALFGPSIDINGEWYRIVTSAFLHVNLLHILFNMFILYQIGPTLERALGPWRYAGVYVLALMGGSLGALLISANALTVGASGAVYGLMGAMFVLSKRRGLNPWSSGIGTLIVVNLVITVAIPRISLGGHVGGLLVGAAAVWLLDPGQVGWRRTATAGAPIIVGGAAALFFGAVGAAGL